MSRSAPISVAAGILRRNETILACRRRADDAFGLKWELPGGKLLRGETPTEALVRELREELGIAADPGPEVARMTYAYSGHPPVQLHFFEVNRFDGEPMNRGFDCIRWTPAEDLLGLDWLEADRPLVQRLAASPGLPLPGLDVGER